MPEISKLKKWSLLKRENVSASPFFPIEKRTYKLPNGNIVDDFFVATLADSAHIVPITKEGKVVMIRMFKQGADDLIIQFPAGRFESKHTSMKNAAARELEEETGIRIDENTLLFVEKTTIMSTKATELAHVYLAPKVELNTQQKLDNNEEIEVVQLSPSQVDQYIAEGKIWDSVAISDWYLVRLKFPQFL